MALPGALLANLTPRERAIFNAGMAAGAAQAFALVGNQHATAATAYRDQMSKRQEQSLKMLGELPAGESNGALAGAEVGRRVVAAGKALLGRK